MSRMGKKSLKVVALALVATLAMGLTVGCSAPKDEPKDAVSATPNEEMRKIGVVQLIEHGALSNANRGFMDGLAANGFVEGENLTVIQRNGQGDQSNLQTIGTEFVSEKVDLICAIATPAALAVANATEDIPIVATAVTDFVEANLVASHEKPGGNITGTSDMNPVSDQIDLLLKIVPGAKKIGVIYSSSETNSQLQVKIMKDYAAELGLEVVEATVSTVNDVQQAAQDLVGKGVEAIYVPTDNVIASAVPVLVGITDEAKIPVICGEASVVEAGCLATYGIDYYKLGLQTGEMAAKILKGEAKPGDMPIETLKEMTTTVNKSSAQILGIELPADVLDGAVVIE